MRPDSTSKNSKRTQKTGILKILKFFEFSDVWFNLSAVESNLREVNFKRGATLHKSPREICSVIDINIVVSVYCWKMQLSRYLVKRFAYSWCFLFNYINWLN